jgi:hypothetical protein
MRRLLLCLLAALTVAGAAIAADSQSLYRLPGNSVLGETDSAATSVVIYTVVTGVANDTGTERCALIGFDCLDAVVFDEAGASGDEFTAADCSTDVADASVALTFCY